MQVGLAAHLAQPEHYLGLATFYQRKRDLFRQGLANSRFVLLPCEGTYFQTVEYGSISDLGDEAFCRWLTQTHGVAAIPMSAFSAPSASDRLAPEPRRVRFCFAKRDETLHAALAKLQPL
jgi:methionine aminotransferase